MGILSTQGNTLQIEDVQHLCYSISSRGQGLIGPSTYLSPFQVLIAGSGVPPGFARALNARVPPCRRNLAAQAGQLATFARAAVWERNIPNRTAMMMYHTAGGQRKPTPNVLS